MISMISGLLYDINGNALTIDCNGIGFEIFVSNPSNFSIGSKYTFYIHEHRKEDSVTLFGFLYKDEKEIFELLIRKVNGIGAKTALLILSKMSAKKLIENIQKNNFEAFKNIPGIGEKTAKRIVLDLGGDISSFLEEKFSNIKEEARNALENLGFPHDRVVEVLKEIEENENLEKLLKEALKRIGNE